MIVLFLLLLFSSGWQKGSTETTRLVLGEDVTVDLNQGKLHLTIPNPENGKKLVGEMGVNLADKDYKLCGENPGNCVEFSSGPRLTIEKVDKCYHINWTTTLDVALEDCFDYGNDSWFGGPENVQQYWPFNNMTFIESSYITKQEMNQGIAEPYWLLSSGFYIYVNKEVPLFIDARNHQSNGFCLIAKQADPFLPRGETSLAYNVCGYSNMKVAHRKAVKSVLGHPTNIPDQRMVQHPIWSTWVRFKVDVNDSCVRQFAQEIVDHGFNNSQLELDDNWETCYGSAQFNTSRFPNMKKLSTDLNTLGFRVTLWNHPFINIDCPLFETAQQKGYLVQNQLGGVASIWWNGVAGVVDFTNPEAADWYVQKRNTMMKNNKIDSLKMDAGESSWLPQIPKETADTNDQPNAFSAAYVTTVAKFGDMVEVRSGHGTQNLPIFVRMLDKDSKWTFDNGLPTIITTALQMNLNGYTLVLPDMVGGNAYNTDVVTKEMFIRWLQANTFLPSIQFSAAPWDFDDETVAISKKFTELHYTYSDQIISVMKKNAKSGEPVNMPIWWADPTNKETWPIWDEYLLGDSLLVAPVVVEGAVKRDIYLPKGKWRDEADPNHKVYQGRQWLKDYSAPLDTLPYFTKVTKLI